jgi:hypothetical protein
MSEEEYYDNGEEIISEENYDYDYDEDEDEFDFGNNEDESGNEDEGDGGVGEGDGGVDDFEGDLDHPEKGEAHIVHDAEWRLHRDDPESYKRIRVGGPLKPWENMNTLITGDTKMARLHRAFMRMEISDEEKFRFQLTKVIDEIGIPGDKDPIQESLQYIDKFQYKNPYALVYSYQLYNNKDAGLIQFQYISKKATAEHNIPPTDILRYWNLWRDIIPEDNIPLLKKKHKKK